MTESASSTTATSGSGTTIDSLLVRNRSRSASVRDGTYGAGSGSRSRRLTRSSRPARRAATASGSCLAALAMMPTIKSVVAVEVPPAEMSGSCSPVTGNSPTT